MSIKRTAMPAYAGLPRAGGLVRQGALAKPLVMLVAIEGLILLMLVSDEMGQPVQPPGEAGQAEARPAGWQANEVAETYE